MKKQALLFSFILTSSFAIDISSIAANAISNNYDLKSIEKSIQIIDEDIKLATLWKNPTLTLGINDIHFDAPLKRDLEPMQGQFVGISQVVPMGEKLEIKEDIAKKDKKIMSLKLEEKKLKLKSKVYEVSFNILVLEKKLKLLNSYENNIKKIEKLSTALYKYGKASQNEILSSKIAYTNIQIQKQNLTNMIKNLYLRLEQITYSKVTNIESSLNMKKIVLNMDTTNHPKILIEEEKAKKFRDISKLELENEKSDIKVNLTYFNRDSKYKDYANISVNIPLSIYKTEKVKSLKSKLKSSEILEKLVDIKQGLKTELLVLENQINNTFLNYQLIENSIIPLKTKMQKNIENYNSFDAIKPQAAIKNLNELISYELKQLDLIKDYYTYYSKTKYYTIKASHENNK